MNHPRAACGCALTAHEGCGSLARVLHGLLAMVTTAEYTDMAINTAGQTHGQSRTPRVAVEVLADAVLGSSQSSLSTSRHTTHRHPAQGRAPSRIRREPPRGDDVTRRSGRETVTIARTSHPRQEGEVRPNPTPRRVWRTSSWSPSNLTTRLQSKSAIGPLLVRLAELVPVSVTSDDRFEQLQSQFLARIEELREPTNAAGNGPFSRFHLMPTCGTEYYPRTGGQGQWSRIYSEN